MKSSAKTALIIVLAVIAAGGALAAGYGLSNTFHNWVDDTVFKKDDAYYPRGATKNEDGTATIKTSFAHTDRSSTPFTGASSMYVIPDFSVSSSAINQNGMLAVTNSLFSSGEIKIASLKSNNTGTSINLLTGDGYDDAVFYSDYDEGIAYGKDFYYAPYADCKEFKPTFSAKTKDDGSLEVTVTYLPIGAKFTGTKPAKKEYKVDAMIPVLGSDGKAYLEIDISFSEYKQYEIQAMDWKFDLQRNDNYNGGGWEDFLVHRNGDIGENLTFSDNLAKWKVELTSLPALHPNGYGYTVHFGIGFGYDNVHAPDFKPESIRTGRLTVGTKTYETVLYPDSMKGDEFWGNVGLIAKSTAQQ